MQEKITSIVDLARYRVGDIAWRVTLCQKKQPPKITNKDKWMLQQHPKTIYNNGPYKKLWQSRKVLPKLKIADFVHIVKLLTSEFRIEQFIVCTVVRSSDTGEFLCYNERDEIMPESLLHNTIHAANRERKRIIKLIKDWSEEQHES